MVGMAMMYLWAAGCLVVAGVAYLARDVFHFQLALTAPLVLGAGLAWYVDRTILLKLRIIYLDHVTIIKVLHVPNDIYT